MRDLTNKLNKRNINKKLLEKYGFKLKNNTYYYDKYILDNKFIINVEYSDILTSKLIEVEFMDEYLQADSNTTGEYAGTIKDSYEEELNNIIENISTKEVYKNKQSKEVINYIKEKYDDNLEFLWEKYDDTAIVRNKINNKWYLLITNISLDKIGDNSSKSEEIIDITYYKDRVDEVIDNKRIFPGYHMNKRSWITIVLDDRLNTNDIYKLIDISYNISISKK